MKQFKKAVSLIAVLAFLITALVPVSGLAAGEGEQNPQQTITLNEISSPTATEDLKWVDSLTSVTEAQETIYLWTKTDNELLDSTAKIAGSPAASSVKYKIVADLDAATSFDFDTGSPENYVDASGITLRNATAAGKMVVLKYENSGTTRYLIASIAGIKFKQADVVINTPDGVTGNAVSGIVGDDSIVLGLQVTGTGAGSTDYIVGNPELDSQQWCTVVDTTYTEIDQSGTGATYAVPPLEAGSKTYGAKVVKTDVIPADKTTTTNVTVTGVGLFTNEKSTNKYQATAPTAVEVQQGDDTGVTLTTVWSADQTTEATAPAGATYEWAIVAKTPSPGRATTANNVTVTPNGTTATVKAAANATIGDEFTVTCKSPETPASPGGVRSVTQQTATWTVEVVAKAVAPAVAKIDVAGTNNLVLPKSQTVTNPAGWKVTPTAAGNAAIAAEPEPDPVLTFAKNPSGTYSNTATLGTYASNAWPIASIVGAEIMPPTGLTATYTPAGDGATPVAGTSMQTVQVLQLGAQTAAIQTQAPADGAENVTVNLTAGTEVFWTDGTNKVGNPSFTAPAVEGPKYTWAIYKDDACTEAAPSDEVAITEAGPAAGLANSVIVKNPASGDYYIKVTCAKTQFDPQPSSDLSATIHLNVKGADAKDPEGEAAINPDYVDEAGNVELPSGEGTTLPDAENSPIKIEFTEVGTEDENDPSAPKVTVTVIWIDGNTDEILQKVPLTTAGTSSGFDQWNELTWMSGSPASRAAEPQHANVQGFLFGSDTPGLSGLTVGQTLDSDMKNLSIPPTDATTGDAAAPGTPLVNVTIVREGPTAPVVQYQVGDAAPADAVTARWAGADAPPTVKAVVTEQPGETYAYQWYTDRTFTTPVASGNTAQLPTAALGAIAQGASGPFYCKVTATLNGQLMPSAQPAADKCVTAVHTSSALNTAALEQAIAKAPTELVKLTEQGIAQSVIGNGSDIPVNQKWVAQSLVTTLNTALTAAQAALNSPTANQGAIDTAATNLNDAITALTNAINSAQQGSVESRFQFTTPSTIQGYAGTTTINPNTIDVSWVPATPVVPGSAASVQPNAFRSWALAATGVNAATAPSLNVMASGTRLTVAPATTLPQSGSWTYQLQALGATNNNLNIASGGNPSIAFTITVSQPSVSSAWAYVSSANQLDASSSDITGYGPDQAAALVGQTVNLPVFKVQGQILNAPAGQSWTAKWVTSADGTLSNTQVTALANNVAASAAPNGVSSYQVQTADTNGANPLYVYCRLQYGDNAASYCVKRFTLNMVPNETLVATNSLRKAATTILADVNSTANTPINLIWLPDVTPTNETYTWTLTSVPVTGATVAAAGQTLGLNGTVTTSVPTLNTNSYSGNGAYTFTCVASSVDTSPVTITVNAQTVSLNPSTAGTYTYQIQPASGKFGDTAYFSAPTGGARPASFYPSNPVVADSTGVLTIGPTNVDLNTRAEIYFNPNNILVNGLPGTYTEEGGANPWTQYFTMNWRCKPGSGVQASGNGIRIPEGQGYSGVDSTLLTIGPVTPAMDGMQFALEIHRKGAGNNSESYLTTHWVRLKVTGISDGTVPTPTITSYPVANTNGVTITQGTNVTFTASAQGSIPEQYVAYQWQRQAPVTASTPQPAWTNIDGETKATLSLEDVAQDLSGTQYRCNVSNTSFSIATSNYTSAIQLTVTAPDGSVSFTAPTEEKLVNLYAGRTWAMDVAAKSDNGNDVTYQWFAKKYINPVPYGERALNTLGKVKSYIAASGSELIEGATGTEYTTQPLEEGVYEFVCRATNATNPAKSATSQPVYVVVTKRSRIPSVTPAVSQGTISTGVVNGQALTLETKAYVASGENLTYAWTVTNPDGTTGTVDCTTATLTIPAITTRYAGCSYQCTVTNPAAGTSSKSAIFYISVWDVADTPIIATAPSNQEPAPAEANAGGVGYLPTIGTAPNQFVNAVQLTSTATVPEGYRHNRMAPAWYKKTTNGLVGVWNLTLPTGVGIAATPISGWATPDKDGVYSSTLTLSGISDAWKARAMNGEYVCIWFNAQSNTAPGTPESWNVSGETSGAVLLAPQTQTAAATVNIKIPGEPQIVTTSEKRVEVPVGSTATFDVTALINESPSAATKGSLVYTWQMTKDGGATWNNCLTTDGTGQFTNKFTTIPLTAEMYNNATASNVAGVPAQAGNSDTVYAYRCIVANRTTGWKAVAEDFNLVIVPGSEQPAPVIKPADGVDLTITDNAEVGKILSGGALVVDKDGHKASEVVGMVTFEPANDAYALRVVKPGAEGAEDAVLTNDQVVGTGCKIELINTADDDKVLDSVTVIVRGDVIGSGIISLTQLVRMAAGFKDPAALAGAYMLAGDMNNSATGTIELTDLVREAAIYRAEILDAGSPSPAPTTEPSTEPTTAPTTEPSTEPTTEPGAEPTAAPTTEPSAEPTAQPTASPTAAPTESPSAAA